MIFKIQFILVWRETGRDQTEGEHTQTTAEYHSQPWNICKGKLTTFVRVTKSRITTSRITKDLQNNGQLTKVKNHMKLRRKQNKLGLQWFRCPLRRWTKQI